jgi:hypothetical protein
MVLKLGRFGAVDQKHLESFEMWCWRRMEKISWIQHVRNEEVLLRVKEQRNILHEMNKRKTNWIGHILRRNCLQRQVIKGKIKGGIEVTGRRGRPGTHPALCTMGTEVLLWGLSISSVIPLAILDDPCH